MEDLHAIGHYGLQDRDAGGQRGKSRHDKENQAEDRSHDPHGRKNLGKGDKHKGGACSHPLRSREDENGRNDHHACQKGDQGIKNLNLRDGLGQVDVFLHIGAVGDHNSHGYRQGEEKLAHGVQQDLQKTPQGQAFHIRRQIDSQPLQAGAADPVRVPVVQEKGKNRDKNNHQKEKRHNKAGGLLDSPFDALVDNERGDQHEDQSIDDRRYFPCDEAGKILVPGRRLGLPDQIGDDVAGDPSPDHRVIGHNQNRDEESENSQKTPALLHFGIGIDRGYPRLSPDGNI